MFAPDKRSSYDVIVLYDMPSTITDQEKEWFTGALKAGKGMVALHHSLGSYPDWPEYRHIIGGCYLFKQEAIAGKEYGPSTYHENLPLTIHILDTHHPITRGLKDFDIEDEVYGNIWIDPNVHPLIGIDHPESSKITGWTHKYDGDRVVYLQSGHGPTAYANESYRKLVHQAILWAGRRS